jgi:hypothetical protein
MAQQAVTARKRVLGHEHPDTLTSMAILSTLLAKMAQREAAADSAGQRYVYYGVQNILLHLAEPRALYRSILIWQTRRYAVQA